MRITRLLPLILSAIVVLSVGVWLSSQNPTTDQVVCAIGGFPNSCATVGGRP
jgi:hypothetical protein